MKSSETDGQDASASAFIARWQGVQLTDATELAASQTFVIELCALLNVPTPLPSGAQDYGFERPVTSVNHPLKTELPRRADRVHIHRDYRLGQELALQQQLR